jgi:hypothetical protein
LADPFEDGTKNCAGGKKRAVHLDGHGL